MDARIKNSINTLNKIIDELSLNTPKKFSESLGFERPERIYKILRGKVAISRKLATIINNKYPQYSIDWLLTGDAKESDNHLSITLNEELLSDSKQLNKLVPFFLNLLIISMFWTNQ